jgi:CheY-like chemotaxis protein
LTMNPSCIIGQIPNSIGVRNIYEANSARTGMSETLRIRPDLVFCDVHMPGEQGFVYVADIRNTPIPGVSATAVVMLTSDAEADTVATAKEVGRRAHDRHERAHFEPRQRRVDHRSCPQNTQRRR